jgi:hypothetical protein
VDEGGSITNATFFLNGRRIASVNAEPFYTVMPLDTLSNAIISVVVTDSAGNVTTPAPLAIETQPSTAAAPLEVKLDSPVVGGSFTAGGQILFAASHNAGNRPVPAIDFYVNGSIFTTLTAEPFTTNLGITRAGTYDIHAVLRSEKPHDGLGAGSDHRPGGFHAEGVRDFAGQRIHVVDRPRDFDRRVRFGRRRHDRRGAVLREWRADRVRLVRAVHAELRPGLARCCYRITALARR